MDPALLCEVSYGEGGNSGMEGLTDLTEDDIVLLDGDYDEDDGSGSPGSKRPFKGRGSATPPVKKVRRLPPKPMVGARPLPRGPHSPGALSPAAVAANLLRNKQLSVTSRPGGQAAKGQGAPGQRPAPLKQSITWKYRQLAENQYTADIRKPDLLKNYEPEQCICKPPKEDEEACGSGCINRSTYNECDPEVCKNGRECTNMAIQRRLYAPGLERFMTAKKGWGVRARQSISKGSFILEYTGEICSSKVFEQRMLSRYTTDNHHYCLAMDNKTMIDAHRAGSECRFVNHSCEPNCEMEKWTVGGLYRMALFSLRDILPGEEICYDYNFSLFNTDQGQECKCGAKSCRGVIGGRGKDYLITIEDGEVKGVKRDGEVKEVKKGKPEKNGKTGVAAPAALDPGSITAQDALWFAQLPPAELVAIERLIPRPDQLSGQCIKCTVCNEQLNYRNRGDLHRHPELGVVMCSKCIKSYGRGGWTKDDEGNDEFCRWCSEGGQIYLCDYCPQAFCNKCLRWNLGRKYLKSIEEVDKWSCLKCDPKPLRELRATCLAINIYHKEKSSRSKTQPATPGTPRATPGTPKKGTKAPPGKASPLANGRTPNGTPKAHQKSVASPIASLHSPKLNGVSKAHTPPATKGHFLDICFKEAEESISRLLEQTRNVANTWRTGNRSPGEVTAAALQLRTVLERGKVALGEADRKVMNSYRSKSKDGDVKNIKPGLAAAKAKLEEGVKKLKEEVKGVVKEEAKEEVKGEVKEEVKGELKEVKVKGEASEHLVIQATEGEAVIEDVVKMESPPKEEAKDAKEESSAAEKEEEGIHDVSVDELEVEDSIMEQLPNVETKELEKEENMVNGDLEHNGDVEEVKDMGTEEKVANVETSEKES